MKKIVFGVIGALVVMTLLTSCQTRAQSGALIGGGLGTGIGALAGGGQGALIGAGIGALTGAVVGDSMDHQCCH